jgi:hypothetical protein
VSVIIVLDLDIVLDTKRREGGVSLDGHPVADAEVFDPGQSLRVGGSACKFQYPVEFARQQPVSPCSTVAVLQKATIRMLRGAG